MLKRIDFFEYYVDLPIKSQSRRQCAVAFHVRWYKSRVIGATVLHSLSGTFPKSLHWEATRRISLQKHPITVCLTRVLKPTFYSWLLWIYDKLFHLLFLFFYTSTPHLVCYTSKALFFFKYLFYARVTIETENPW